MRKKRKGFKGKTKHKDSVVYAAGVFGAGDDPDDNPGPSKRTRTD